MKGWLNDLGRCKVKVTGTVVLRASIERVDECFGNV